MSLHHPLRPAVVVPRPQCRRRDPLVSPRAVTGTTTLMGTGLLVVSVRFSIPGPALGGVPLSPVNPSSMRHLHVRGGGNASSPSPDHVLTPRSAMTPRAATGRASTISGRLLSIDVSR